jgi:hypothetical protein
VSVEAFYSSVSLAAAWIMTDVHAFCMHVLQENTKQPALKVNQSYVIEVLFVPRYKSKFF